MTPFEEFKVSEYKGDLLLNLIVCDILMKRGVARQSVSQVANVYTSNAYLSYVFDKLELKLDQRDISTFTKPYKLKANTVESHIWNFFETFGYDDTVTYFERFVPPIEQMLEPQIYAKESGKR
jgi:hypothetical protein